MQIFILFLSITFILHFSFGADNDNETTKNETSTSKQLRILMFICRHQLNRSHANYAASIVREMRKKHYMRFIICILRDEDEFDEETTKELEIEYKKFGHGVKFESEKTLERHFHGSARIQYWIDLLKDTNYMNKLHAEHFHIGMGEMLTPHDYAFAIYHALNLPVVVTIKNFSPDSLQLMQLGASKELIEKCIPTVKSAKIGDHLAVLDKQISRCKEIRKSYAEYETIKTEKKQKTEEFFKKLPTHLFPGFKNTMDKTKSPVFPGSQKIFEQSRFFFLNSQPELEFDGGHALANVPKVKWIGGIHMDHGNPLPLKKHLMEKYEKLASTDQYHQPGIVLISFGSGLGAFGQVDERRFHVIRAAIDAFPGLLFVWKLSPGDVRIKELAKVPNIYADDWVDQQAILASPHIRAFISHCGRNSQLEAAFNGVPLICVPLLHDQFYNAESAAQQQLGVVLDINCLDFEAHNPNGVPKDYCFTIETLINKIEIATMKMSPIDKTKLEVLKISLQKRKSPGEIILDALDEIALKIS